MIAKPSAKGFAERNMLLLYGRLVTKEIECEVWSNKRRRVKFKRIKAKWGEPRYEIEERTLCAKTK